MQTLLMLLKALNVFATRKELSEVMATVADLKAAVGTLKTTLTAALGRIQEDFDALKAKIASGVVIEQSDLDSVTASITGANDAIAGIDPDPDNPPKPPQTV